MAVERASHACARAVRAGGAVSRRINQAIDLGYLVNEQEKKGQPAKLKVGEPMPDEVGVLPSPDLFASDGCSVAAPLEGEGVPEVSPSDASTSYRGDGPFLEAAE
jgi:hypothetical protein